MESQTLAKYLSWLVSSSYTKVYAKVVDLIPSQGTYRKPTNA